LGWRIEVDPPARRALRKLERDTSARIIAYLNGLTALDDPRTRGHGLRGPLAGFWRYRVGDYRLICRLQDDRLVLLILEIGHRSEVYR
jgi:mRNA interferase RelE/StbE